MLEYFNKEKYDEYVYGLNNAVTEGKWLEYMKSHEDPKVYLKSSYTHEYDKVLSAPYYSEISVDLISSCNTSSVRKEIPSNFERVIRAIPYILNNECRPIGVIKHGEEYYIENGKHRFYAHILLKLKTLPVSIREVIKEGNEKSKGMISINRPFYDNDGMRIAYPEMAMEFFEKYRDLFESIRSVEMISMDDLKTSKLQFNLFGGDVVEFLGCCTAGNAFRSSQVTYRILNQCGYQIDMKYITRNPNFKLEDKRDAHNLNFEADRNDGFIKKSILPNLDALQPWNKDEKIADDFLKLHDYVSGYKPFDVPGTYFSAYSSSFLQIDDMNTYLVGSENRKGMDSIYIFVDSCVPFNSMTVEFMGVISSRDEIYKKIDSNKQRIR